MFSSGVDIPGGPQKFVRCSGVVIAANITCGVAL